MAKSSRTELKLTRAQEIRLIQLGIDTLLAKMYTNTPPQTRNYKPWNKGKKNVQAWTDERRKKFSETMRKKWAAKRRNER